MALAGFQPARGMSCPIGQIGQFDEGGDGLRPMHQKLASPSLKRSSRPPWAPDQARPTLDQAPRGQYGPIGVAE